MGRGKTISRVRLGDHGEKAYGNLKADAVDAKDISRGKFGKRQVNTALVESEEKIIWGRGVETKGIPTIHLIKNGGGDHDHNPESPNPCWEQKKMTPRGVG